MRGVGLMLGVEIVDPAGAPDALGHPPADGARARRFQRECLRRGLILELGGRHGATVRLLLPLITTAQNADFIAQILREAAEEREHPADTHARAHVGSGLRAARTRDSLPAWNGARSSRSG